MLTSTVVLILYLTTPSTNTGMTAITAEFNSAQACEAAGEQAKRKLGGWATTAYWICAPKGTAPAAPQSH